MNCRTFVLALCMGTALALSVGASHARARAGAQDAKVEIKASASPPVLGYEPTDTHHAYGKAKEDFVVDPKVVEKELQE